MPSTYGSTIGLKNTCSSTPAAAGSSSPMTVASVLGSLMFCTNRTVCLRHIRTSGKIPGFHSWILTPIRSAIFSKRQPPPRLRKFRSITLVNDSHWFSNLLSLLLYQKKSRIEGFLLNTGSIILLPYLLNSKSPVRLIIPPCSDLYINMILRLPEEYSQWPNFFVPGKSLRNYSSAPVQSDCSPSSWPGLRSPNLARISKNGIIVFLSLHSFSWAQYVNCRIFPLLILQSCLSSLVTPCVRLCSSAFNIFISPRPPAAPEQKYRRHPLKCGPHLPYQKISSE